MGLGLGFSRSTYDGPGPLANEPPNPDPANYRILRADKHGPFLLVEVLYPDCTNYEGRKILLYKGVTLADFDRQGSIDPHFSENPKFASPIARFVPTQTGWEMGKCMMAMPLAVPDA
jgi:hypothetical protein